MWETQNEVSSSLSSQDIMFLGENKKTLKKLPSYNVIDPERTQCFGICNVWGDIYLVIEKQGKFPRRDCIYQLCDRSEEFLEEGMDGLDFRRNMHYA